MLKGTEDGRGKEQRTRVAILGGGPASLTAAYYLTELEREKYDVTVYEMSWRLGGKTASGRGEGGRIEEHGLHVLFGGYHNTFDLMLGCYEGVRRECPEARTFPHFFDTLLPSDFGVIGDDRGDTWRKWDLQFPGNTGLPGDPPKPTTWELALGLVQVFIHLVFGGTLLRRLQRTFRRLAGLKLPHQGRRRAREVPDDGGDWFMNRVIIPCCLDVLDRDTWKGKIAHWFGRRLHRVIHRLERRAWPYVKKNAVAGRLWTAADLILATCRGLSADRVLFRPDGYQRIDHLDLREWLRNHGARSSTLRSPLVRIVYDAAFSYPFGGRRSGDQERLTEAMAAGAAMRVILWMALSYKGAMYYKMKAGMGDVMHVPLYHLLKKRGVKFKFFHRVKALRAGVDEEGRHVVDEVELEELAQALPDTEYDPLIQVGALDCWPAKPQLPLLTEATRDNALHAEQFFHRPKGSTPVVLPRRGRLLADGRRAGDEDSCFDRVIFGIPVGCVPYLCEDLARTGRGKWNKQDQVSSIQTVALQMWSKYQLGDLGWNDPPPLLSLFWDPLNTWSDMNQVLPCEQWEHGREPAMVAYFCGPLPHLDPTPERDRFDPEADAKWRKCLDDQKLAARDCLFARLHELWPQFSIDRDSKRITNWHVMHDSSNRAGEGRREAQYLRANFDPHERCTLALPGESENRIDPADTGFANLTVAGDWTANDILAACCEGTVQSGIRAARAISSRKELYRIIGEDLLNPGRTFARRPSRRDPPELHLLPGGGGGSPPPEEPPADGEARRGHG